MLCAHMSPLPFSRLDFSSCAEWLKASVNNRHHLSSGMIFPCLEWGVFSGCNPVLLWQENGRLLYFLSRPHKGGVDASTNALEKY